MLRWAIFAVGAILVLVDIFFWYSLPTPPAIAPVNIFILIVSVPALLAPWLGKRVK